MKKLLLLIGQVFLLWAIYQLGTWCVALLNLPIPGSVLGMLILFALLVTGILKEEWLADSANFLLKHLAFFFIPIAVGLMEWGDLFLQKGLWLLVALVISAIVALFTTGFSVQLLIGTTSPEAAQKGENN